MGDAVCLGYLHSNEVAHSWHLSVMDMLAWDVAHHQRLVRGGFLAMRCGSGGLVEARNETVRRFLAGAADWLFWLDTDMGCGASTVDRLIEAADSDERPIVGALCFAQQEYASDGLGGHRTRPAPTLYRWVEGGDRSGFTSWLDYPRDELVQVAATGSACLVIHRDVFEKIAAQYGDTWYTRMVNPATGQLLSEDLSFCARAAAVSVPTYVHTGIRTTHLKSAWLGEDAFEASQAPQPATEDVAVIVPVLGRPHAAAPVMASVRATTGLARVYAVVGPEDPEREAVESAWRAAGATVIEADRPSFAAKANHAYRATSEPWLFLAGDDVKFHPGWYDRAVAAAGDRFHVVGTNDLANPRVVSGEHGTHLLVRRSYVDEHGASWDGPGVVCHEGYRHWYVDDEIVTAAKQRGVWTPAPLSVIEHLHPLYGKGEPDATYKLGQARADADRALFEQRLQEHA